MPSSPASLLQAKQDSSAPAADSNKVERSSPWREFNNAELIK
jgi:hypothetical protein